MSEAPEAPYEVQLLAYHSPHQLWVLPLHTSNGIKNVEQIGLYGALGQTLVVDDEFRHLTMQPSHTWTPATHTALAKFFKDKRVMFTPVMVIHNGSIFDDNIVKFGEISTQSTDGTIVHLSQYLGNEHLTHLSNVEFLEYVKTGRLPPQLNTFETTKVISSLIQASVNVPLKQWKEMILGRVQTFTSLRVFESEMRATTSSSFEAERKIKAKCVDFELCKGADYEYLGIPHQRRVPQNLNKSHYQKKLEAAKKLVEMARKRKELKSGEIQSSLKEEPVARRDDSRQPKETFVDHTYKELECIDISNKNKYAKDECGNAWRDSENEEYIIDTIYINPTVGEDSFLDLKPKRKFKQEFDDLDFVPKVISHDVYHRNSSKQVSRGNSQMPVTLKQEPSTLEGNSSVSLEQSTSELENGSSASLEHGTSSSLEHETSTSEDIEEEMRRLEQELTRLIKIKTAKSTNVTPKVIQESQKESNAESAMGKNTNLKQSQEHTLKLPNQPKEENINDLDTPILEEALPKKEHIKKQNAEIIPIPHEYCVNPFEYGSKFIHQIVTSKLMLHSKNKLCIKPVTELKNIFFTDEIHYTLVEMGMKVPLTLQTVSWPAILRGHSFFTVSPRRSGKTMGYIPAICRHVVDNKADNSGPIAIILCDTTKVVVEVAQICKRFLKGKKSVLNFYAGINLEDIIMNLLNGCDILVCTPFYLCKLFSLGTFSLDLNFLSIVVLDGCDRIDKIYFNEYKIFFGQIRKMLKTRVNKHHQVQYIVASTEWCKLMAQLVQKLPNPVICIAAYHECAVYANAYTSVVFDMDNSKMYSLLEFFKEIDISKKSVVVCNTDDEIKEVTEALKSMKYTVLSGSTELGIQELYNLNQSWFDYDSPCLAAVLVCCDENLRNINATDAHYLVHYSLPSMFTSFCKRFSVLIDHYKSIFEDKDTGVRINILVDSENTTQLPKLLNFMKRCTDKIPPELNEISKKILSEKDKQKAKSHYPVCDNILAFGDCHDFWYCEKRHTLFPPQDIPVEWMPKNGSITFRILHYHTPTHYSAELTSYTEDGKPIKIASAITRIAMKVNLYFNNEKNKRLHGIPKLGDICGVSTKRNYFERCQVVHILSIYKNGNPEKVLTRRIDEEMECVVSDAELFHLPDHLKEMVSHVVQVRLANIKPKDKDVTYSDIAKDSLARKVKEENTYLRAKIAVIIGNTIVVDELEACQDIKTTYDTVLICTVKEFLCEKHAEPNDEHLPKLFKLCETNGIALPTEEKKVAPKVEVKKEVKPQWAHLESGPTPLVYFCSALNPGKFYVRLVKFSDCLDNLTNDIQKYIDNNKTEVTDVFGKGDFVLAKFPDDMLYYRARIDNIPHDSSKHVRCFFVDHGDWRDVNRGDLEALPESLITVLPFQAIECRLIGLQPIGEEWTDWSTNYMSTLCFFREQYLKDLYVKYFVKEPAEDTGGSKYGIVMIDTHSDEDIIINDLMVNTNVAAFNEEEHHFLDNIKYEVENNEYNDSNGEDIQISKVKPDAYTGTDSKTKPGGLSITQPEEYSNDGVSEDGFDFVNEEMITELILGPQKQCSHKNFLRLRSAPENSQNTSSEDVSRERVSSCSTYEILAQPEFKELDSDDLTFPEDSNCHLTVKSKDDQFVENTQKKLKADLKIETISKKNLIAGITQKQIKHNLLGNDDSESKLKKDTGKIESSSTSSETNSVSNRAKKPKLIWHQTRTYLVIKIQIVSIEKFDIDIQTRTLAFATHAHDNDYAFTIKFYGTVIPSKCTHTAKGLYLLIKLTKLMKMDWMSLTEDCEKRPWIVYDQDSLVDDGSDSDEIAYKEEQMKELHNYQDRREESAEMCLEDDDY